MIFGECLCSHVCDFLVLFWSVERVEHPVGGTTGLTHPEMQRQLIQRTVDTEDSWYRGSWYKGQPIQRTADKKDSWYKGQLLQRSADAKDSWYIQWTAETKNSWCKGQLIQRTADIKDSWYIGQLIQKTAVTNDRWYKGQPIQRIADTKEQLKFSGAKSDISFWIVLMHFVLCFLTWCFIFLL